MFFVISTDDWFYLFFLLLFDGWSWSASPSTRRTHITLHLVCMIVLRIRCNIQIKYCTEFIIYSATVQLHVADITTTMLYNVHLTQWAWAEDNLKLFTHAQFVFSFCLKKKNIFFLVLFSQTNDGRTWHVPRKHESPDGATAHTKNTRFKFDTWFELEWCELQLHTAMVMKIAPMKRQMIPCGSAFHVFLTI